MLDLTHGLSYGPGHLRRELEPDMASSTTRQRRPLFWIALLLGFCLLLWLLRRILPPFVLGMAIGYLLDPLVGALERRGVSRAVASGGLIVGFFLVGTVVLLLVLPVVVEQTVALARRLPALVTWVRESLLPLADGFLARIGAPQLLDAGLPLGDTAHDVLAVAGRLSTRLLSGGLAIVNVIALLAVTPLVAFYLLRDWPRLVAEVDGWLPRQHAATIREQARRIDEVLAGFARGAAVVCAVLAVFYAVLLSLVGLEFGLVIGLSAGALSFVPYVGAGFGLVSSVGVALYQFWPDWVRIVVVVVIFFAGQVLFDYVLTPKLVGDRVHLHPLWVMFGVFAGGALFGFVGILLAVPACAVIGVLVRFGIARYKESPLYLAGSE